MPLLDIQRRMAEIGRIRIGKREGNRPTKLETFRVTSQSKDIIESVASVYGGEVSEWRPGPKEPVQWQVITDADTLDIIVAPGQVLTQWYETWSGGGCQRRCDGVTEQLTDSPCVCPADPEERRTAATKGAACKPTTRLSVMLRDVQALGLFRLESHGYYAAVELSGVAEILEHATRRGMFIPAKLRLDQRTSKKNGQTMRYAVPMIEIHHSFGQVAEALGVLPTPALPTPSSAISGRPALPEGTERGIEPEGLPALPRSPKGRQKKTELPSERPSLPSDPSFKHEEQAITMAEVPPARPVADDAAAKRAQAVHMQAQKRGIEEPLLRELIEHVSQGRTRSARELDDNEAGQVQVLMFKVATGKTELKYGEDGRLLI